MNVNLERKKGCVGDLNCEPVNFPEDNTVLVVN